jgi:hypothetical protein
MLLGAGLEWSARHGRRALLPSEASQARARLAIFRRRILPAQTLYALAALICLISTVASVIALAVVQRYFIVSPRRHGGAACGGQTADQPANLTHSRNSGSVLTLWLLQRSTRTARCRGRCAWPGCA